MTADHVLLAFCWVVYCLLHSILAGDAIKNYFQKNWIKAFSYYRFAYNLFAFASLAAIIWYQVSLTTIYLFTPALILKIVGGTTAAVGLCLMLICIKKYFTGLSGMLDIRQKKSHPSLIITGVHRYVRHPLYLGTFVFIWGLWIIFPLLSLFISNTIITVYTLMGIELEEKKLLAVFGEAYKTYREKVPKLIPKF